MKFEAGGQRLLFILVACATKLFTALINSEAQKDSEFVAVGHLHYGLKFTGKTAVLQRFHNLVLAANFRLMLK